jgi:hypothetical protein
MRESRCGREAQNIAFAGRHDICKRMEYIEEIGDVIGGEAQEW